MAPGAVGESDRGRFYQEDAEESNSTRAHPKFMQPTLLGLIGETLYHELRVWVAILEGHHVAEEEPFKTLRAEGHQHAEGLAEVQYEVEPSHAEAGEFTFRIASQQHKILGDNGRKIAQHVIVRFHRKFIFSNSSVERCSN